ncbi:MAG: hypothetical protein JWN04_700 [Myxococcaceae bacterium]|nr:hypothetical protein [Myxococcaceae bacterium]
MEALHFAFLIAVLTQLAKAGDLILRPRQQRWLQDRLETLALILSELSTAGLRRWSGYDRGVDTLWIISIAGAFLAQPVLIAQELQEGLPTWKVVFGAVVGPCTLLSMLVLRRKYGARLRAWMFAEGFTVRAVMRTVSGPCLYAACACIAECNAAIAHRGTVLPVNLMVAMQDFPYLVWLGLGCTVVLAIICPVLFAWFLLLNLAALHSTVMLLVRIGSWTLVGLLALLRGLVWRIVEYNKGAWSAITLIMTGLLAVAELIARTE